MLLPSIRTAASKNLMTSSIYNSALQLLLPRTNDDNSDKRMATVATNIPGGEEILERRKQKRKRIHKMLKSRTPKKMLKPLRMTGKM